ncbi:MAG: hypothetical protein ACFFE8_16820 [Candidatus Heimdallarchaeota archaeon]
MRHNIWVERGLEALQKGQWFDGLQMIQGAVERTGRQDQPDVVEQIINQILPIFPENWNTLVCELVREILTQIRIRKSQLEWVKLIPLMFSIIREIPRKSCVSLAKNQIVMDAGFLNNEFLVNLEGVIAEEKSGFVLGDLYYCSAGLFSRKKDFVRCYEALKNWKEHGLVTPRLGTYLLLAEVNAYEIDECPDYMIAPESEVDKQTEDYAILGERICHAVELTDQVEFNNIMFEFKELINSDGLLKTLCDGINGILHPAKGSGLLGSLFGNRNS